MKRRGWILWTAGGALGFLVMLRLFVFALFRVPSASMVPTIQYGAHVAINKLAHPSRGDVIVFRYPKEPDKDFLKRVIAVGGDRVEVRGRQLSINGTPVPQRKLDGECNYSDFDELANAWHVRDCEAFEEELDGKKYRVVFDRGDALTREYPFGSREPFRVPDGHLFVMGDNRDNSHDSRYWGSVAPELVRGTLLGVWLSGKGELTIPK